MNNPVKIKSGLLMRKILTILLLLVFALVYASCGSSGKSASVAPAASYSDNQTTSNGNIYAEAPQAQAAPPYSPGYDGSGLGDSVVFQEKVAAENIVSQRKIIMNGNVSIETLNFDESVNALDQLIKEFGGFAEIRNIKGKSMGSKALRSAHYIIRVPAESFETVLKSMGNIGTVIESSSEGTDITDQYYDTEARIKALKVQEETLLDIMAKSTKLEDVITLEQRISEVRYEIESLENKLKNYDRLVAFSRITVNINEVTDKTETKPEPVTLSERASRSFAQSIENFTRGFENFIIWLLYSWINIILFLITVFIVVMIIKKKKKRLTKSASQQKEGIVNVENKNKDK